MRGLTPAKAFQEGTNIRTALRLTSEVVWAWVNLELTKLIADLNANNTFKSLRRLLMRPTYSSRSFCA